jgi:hypothetical protein
LRKFAGLGAKIRHNGVRETLPHSFRLMSLAGLEIDAFAAYAEDRSRRHLPYSATVDGKTRDLIAFLGEWLDPADPVHCLLWDMVRHEQALDELGRQPPVPPRPAARPPDRTSAPCIDGRLLLHEMKSEPRTVAARLYEKAPRIDDIELAPRLFCYWRPGGAAAIEILELDEFGYCLLGLVDGTRSLADLSADMGCGRRPSRPFLQAVRQIASTGILRFRGRQERP